MTLTSGTNTIFPCGTESNFLQPCMFRPTPQVLHPILIYRTPYGSGPYRENKLRYTMTHLLDSFYTHRKYIFVFQDVRGRFMSEGTFVNVRPLSSSKEIDEGCR